MSKTYIQAVQLPVVPKELITALQAQFPAPDICPNFNRDEALWAAACHHVIKWIVAKSGEGTSVSGDPRDLVRPDVVNEQKARVRFGS